MASRTCNYDQPAQLAPFVVYEYFGGKLLKDAQG